MSLPSLPIPGNVLAGLLAAFFWGGGDFSGGMASQHAGGSVRAALRVIILSHFSSLAMIVIVALLRGDPPPHGAPLAWGVAGGVTAGISLVGFYMALARGAMGAPAAISGLLAAAVPAAVAAISEGSPGALRLTGFVIAGIAIWTVAAAPTGALEARHSRSTMLLAIASGAGFGIYFVELKLAAAAGPVWPMACTRAGSLTVCSIILFGLSTHSPQAEGGTYAVDDRPVFFGLPRQAIGWALSTATLDSIGNLSYIAATRSGRLDVAAVLASLYPASTILLAGIVLKERLSRRQSLGMAIAAGAVVMITL